jgi:hypothetical protein
MAKTVCTFPVSSEAEHLLIHLRSTDLNLCLLFTTLSIFLLVYRNSLSILIFPNKYNAKIFLVTFVIEILHLSSVQFVIFFLSSYCFFLLYSRIFACYENIFPHDSLKLVLSCHSHLSLWFTSNLFLHIVWLTSFGVCLFFLVG